MKYYTFQNVTISVRAKTGQEAYTKLCNQLDALNGDWWTDTYLDEEGEERETSELFPK